MFIKLSCLTWYMINLLKVFKTFALVPWEQQRPVSQADTYYFSPSWRDSIEARNVGENFIVEWQWTGCAGDKTHAKWVIITREHPRLRLVNLNNGDFSLADTSLSLSLLPIDNSGLPKTRDKINWSPGRSLHAQLTLSSWKQFEI